ncbi:hypothetical protein HETIRDRAFT_470016 [Heterobasidion irregulare TC 32-1]|uniref:Uncharacterized protein n=1 Tax=Heterobasidion irregulare (strain TC 32-1) TaxID=747525 RepID=W4KQZ8_HETIT|nr:uncharacterized protein HETIRDRAFT_470016 [Heterobasidion irregulare TC 32-1]ETW87810.1 hypothetical protein HETIRDRAFT_470016 [Heterobasidion irregulare TC 32-1]
MMVRSSDGHSHVLRACAHHRTERPASPLSWGLSRRRRRRRVAEVQDALALLEACHSSSVGAANLTWRRLRFPSSCAIAPCAVHEWQGWEIQLSKGRACLDTFWPRLTVLSTRCHGTTANVLGGKRHACTWLSALPFRIFNISNLDAATTGTTTTLPCRNSSAFRLIQVRIYQHSARHISRLCVPTRNGNEMSTGLRHRSRCARRDKVLQGATHLAISGGAGDFRNR